MADDKAKDTGKTKASDSEAASICKQALQRYQRGIERERDNIDEAYEDLKFSVGNQWSDADKQLRVGRPILTVNRLPQFIRQVTGDMRQMKPGIKVVPVDARGDKDTAETIAGMIRYIENRSDAGAAYIAAADSQVRCGVGAIQVTKEYAVETTFNQEIRILGVDDAVSIVWDPDAVLPCREDAKWCIVPTDISRESFKENYPDVNIEDFDSSTTTEAVGWFDNDMVRIAQYWVKVPMKRMLALLPDGGIADLTDKDEDERLEIGKTAKKVEERDGYKLVRYLITSQHVLEKTDWPGMHIPIVPVIGEEIRIGRELFRHGLIRFARDAQRMYNYYSSMDAEVVALQPKSPFIGTEKNVEKYQEQWATANNEAHPVLIYTPDSANGGIAPQRAQPPVSSQGIQNGLLRAVDDMKAVIGIYDASLGQRSNETSGKAIMARQREGDTGSYVYVDNWIRAIKRVGVICADLIPHVYDTERQIRIMGEDGKVDMKWINRSVGLNVMNPESGEPEEQQQIENDVTVGAYDIVMDTGPSFTTKRQEARESMTEFVRSAPQTAPAIMDLVAKAQDWPLADEVGKRLEAIAPPPIQKLIAQQKQESGEEERPAPPSPQEQQQQQIHQAAIQIELEGKQLANEKIKAEIAKIAQPEQADPSVAIKAQAEQLKIQNEARKAEIEQATAMFELEHKRQIAAIELETKLADLAIKKQGLQLDTARATMDLRSKDQALQQQAEAHAASLTQQDSSADQAG